MPDLYGRVDLLTEDDDQLVISDVKTSRSRWGADQAEESAEQLLPAPSPMACAGCPFRAACSKWQG